MSESTHTGEKLTPNIETTLEEVNEYLQILALPLLERIVSKYFDTPKHLRAYLLINGLRSTTEIGEVIGIPQRTISDWFKKWANELGIVESTGPKGQYSKKYSLIDLAYKDNENWIFLGEGEHE